MEMNNPSCATVTIHCCKTAFSVRLFQAVTCETCHSCHALYTIRQSESGDISVTKLDYLHVVARIVAPQYYDVTMGTRYRGAAR